MACYLRAIEETLRRLKQVHQRGEVRRVHLMMELFVTGQHSGSLEPTATVSQHSSRPSRSLVTMSITPWLTPSGGGSPTKMMPLQASTSTSRTLYCTHNPGCLESRGFQIGFQSARVTADLQSSEACSRWKKWWSWGGSNPRPLDCQSNALPTELQPHPSADLIVDSTRVARQCHWYLAHADVHIAGVVSVRACGCGARPRAGDSASLGRRRARPSSRNASDSEPLPEEYRGGKRVLTGHE